MIPKLKSLGLALVAMLALSAVIASAASATNFTASSYPTAATAESALGNDVFKTEGGSWECKTHYAAAALSAPSETLTVTPTWTSCKSFGFLSATVNTNGCDLVFHVSGAMDYQCPSGKAITIVSGTCEISIGAQKGLQKVDFANSAGKISAQFTVTGISYTVLKDGFGCPFGGTGLKTGATYTQSNPITYASTNGATLDIG